LPVVVDSLDFTFLDAVNRILRTNGIIRGDDDEVTTFNDVQHNATLNLAKIAVQDELVEMTSDRLIPLEQTEGTLTTSVGVRTYALASDFVQFYGTPFFYDATGNRQLYEYPGGEQQLRLDVFDYKTVSGDPNDWYFIGAATNQVGFYQVPNNSKTYAYDYERSVYVENSTDEIPFHTNEQCHAFCAAAGRRFKFLFENAQNVDLVLANDASYQSARSRLARLIKGRNPYGTYGSDYA
jgi:hypothetical protein